MDRPQRRDHAPVASSDATLVITLSRIALTRSTGFPWGGGLKRRTHHGVRLWHRPPERCRRMWEPSKAERPTIEDHLELQSRFRSEEPLAVAAAAVGCSVKSVQRLLRKTGAMANRGPTRSKAKLSAACNGEAKKTPTVPPAGLPQGQESQRIHPTRTQYGGC